MNRVQVVLSGFRVKLLCFVHAKLYVFLASTRACVCRCDVIFTGEPNKMCQKVFAQNMEAGSPLNY